MVEKKIFILSFILSFSFELLGFDISTHLNQKTEVSLEKEILNSLSKNVQDKASPLIPTIVKLSEVYNVDAKWVTAIIWTESHFKVKAQSKVGARGLMQIMPKTQGYLEKKLIRSSSLLFEYEKSDASLIDFGGDFWANDLGHYREILKNLELGINYLIYLENKFGNKDYAAVAYNMGPTWVSRNLARNKEVGSSNNQYLNKIKKHYDLLLAKNSVYLASNSK